MLLISSSLPEIISTSIPAHRGQIKKGSAMTKVSWHGRHRILSGTSSISSTAPSAIPPRLIAAKAKRRASGTTRAQVPDPEPDARHRGTAMRAGLLFHDFLETLGYGKFMHVYNIARHLLERNPARPA